MSTGIYNDIHLLLYNYFNEFYHFSICLLRCFISLSFIVSCELHSMHFNVLYALDMCSYIFFFKWIWCLAHSIEHEMICWIY
jgi:hypothetical protein